MALLGTGRWHFWAQVGALLGTGGRTAGHRWVHCWAQVGALLGTGWCIAGHRWAELVCGTAGHRSSGHW
ncbi:unnamed protein product [Staurois parvus]|uniref:Uncharacterized protein n=1 Tax=Staurois parvus TaxID=386267 RepID=A0ABN9BHG5_9NEOB|nr:unnamed protein product [Staurois parvus]